MVASGLERRAIFCADVDFVARLTSVAEQRALTVYAWPLLPNPFHLLALTRTRPLARAVRSCLGPPYGTVPQSGTLFFVGLPSA